MIDSRFTKAVSSVITVQSETNTSKSVQDSSLRYTLCDRDNTGDKKGNYFVSLGLPTTSSDLGTGSTVSLYYPELQQLNVDQIVMAEIPASSYSEFIDGRSITWKVPLNNSSASQSSLSSITFYSSTYTSDKVLRSERNPLLGDNVVFLFSDSLNKPFTGYTVNEMGIQTNHATVTTWEPDTTNFLRRPSAISYTEVKGTSLNNGFNTDTRTPLYSVRVPSNYPENMSGYNYDIPAGFAVLDKGLLVLTHTAITQNFAWGSGYTYGTGAIAPTSLSGRTNIYFTGTTNGSDKASLLTFKDINTSFKITAVCLAMPKEFYISNNATWNREKALSELNSQAGIVSLDPVYVTEVGLYNALGELIAVAKLSEPVEKTFINVLTFNIDIEV